MITVTKDLVQSHNWSGFIASIFNYEHNHDLTSSDVYLTIDNHLELQLILWCDQEQRQTYSICTFSL